MIYPKQQTDSELRRWPLDRLKYLFLEMGLQCNVRCSMCFQTDFSPQSRMPDLIWKERLLPIYATATRLAIAGGEPTVLPNCRKLLELVTQDFPDLRLDTVTDGIRFEGLWEEVFLHQGDFVNFSLNAVTPDLYERIVQFGNFHRAVGNILRLVKRKTETGSPLVIRISTVMMQETTDELPRFVEWAVSNGLDQALVYPDYLNQPFTSPPAVVQKRIAESYEIADRHPGFKLIHLDDRDWAYAQQHGVTPVRPRVTLPQDRRPCPSAFDMLYVHHDGTAKPCCKSWYLFGNLLRSSLEDVWQGTSAYRFRRRMRSLDFRDCTVACDLNCNPIDHRLATARKAYWVIRRDPKSAIKKGLRRLGLTTAQVKDKRKATLEPAGKAIAPVEKGP